LKIERAKFWNTLVCRGAQKQCFRSTLGFQSISNREEQGGGGLGSGGVGGGGEEERRREERRREERGAQRCSIVIMVNFTDRDSKESVGVEEVKEELAKARVELGRKRREVEEAEAKVRKLEEQLDVLVKLEEEVGEVGAVNRAAGGEPGASVAILLKL